MHDFDFTKPQPPEAPAGSAPFKAAQSRFYDAKAAEAVFRSSGREERFPAGATIFTEDEQVSKGGLLSRKGASRMYYLAEGQVALTIAGRPLDIVQAGEVFGEMAVISGRPRSATATARTACLARSMDPNELQAAVGRTPEFALMLGSVMYDRLRFLAARAAQRPKNPSGTQPLQASFFAPSLVAKLEASLPPTALIRYPQQAIIFREGQAGTLMYVVKSGRVGIAIGPEIVEVVGPGGTFGEMAVVDQSPRTARAGSLEYTEALAIDRRALLQLIGADPAFAMALLRGVAERLRHMTALLAPR